MPAIVILRDGQSGFFEVDGDLGEEILVQEVRGLPECIRTVLEMRTKSDQYDAGQVRFDFVTYRKIGRNLLEKNLFGYASPQLLEEQKLQKL